MSWAIGHDTRWGRYIGYGVPATCDSPHCNAEIDRGLSYVCGSEPYGGDVGCGLYFCSEHLRHSRRSGYVCARCNKNRTPYEAKKDTLEWVHHMVTDESWAEWRETPANAKQLQLMKERLENASYQPDVCADLGEAPGGSSGLSSAAG